MPLEEFPDVLRGMKPTDRRALMIKTLVFVSSRRAEKRRIKGLSGARSFGVYRVLV
jgi:hypothetical protein